MKSPAMSSAPRRALLTAFILALATLALHHAALRAGWTFDDPVHLRFAIEHSPWQYFTQREVMLRQSYAHITPWNAFFYDLGLPWAGLDARGHHAHLLAVIAATAIATWALLRRWLPPAAALAGALLFLAMVPTKVVGLTVSTGHYAYGLLFSVLAIHAWAHALDGPPATPAGPAPKAGAGTAWPWALLAAVLYALACLCKELYAPLPAVLLALPAARPTLWRRRLALFMPVLLVALGYALMRLWLFGGSGVGGYAQLSVRALPAWADLAARLLRGLHQMLFGLGPTAWAALALATLLLLRGLWARAPRPRPAAVFFLLACAVALAPPVIAYAAVQLWIGDHRIVLPLAWALAVALAWQARPQPRRPWVLAALALLGALFLVGQYQAQYLFGHLAAPAQAQNQYVIDSGPGDILVPRDYANISYLRDLGHAAALRDGRPRARVIADEEELVALGPQQGPAAVAWDADCPCLRPLGERHAQRKAQWRQQLQQGAGRPWSLQLQAANTGRSRVLMQWQVQAGPGTPPLQGVRIELQGIAHFGGQPHDQLAFGIDNTMPLWQRSTAVRVLAQAADGALLRSPLLQLPLDRDTTVEWSAPVQEGAAGASSESGS